MTYAAVRDGVLGVARGASGFGTATVAYADYEPLNAGNDHAIIVQYAGVKQEYDTFGNNLWCDWHFRLELHNAMTDIPTAIAAADTDRQAILDAFRKYPQLNGTVGVFHAMVETGSNPREPVSIGQAGYWKEDFNLQVREDVSGTAVE